MFELYKESKYDCVEDSIQQEVLFIGTEQQCIDYRKEVVEQIEFVGRITDNRPDVGRVTVDHANSYQLVVTNLGTSNELHMKFVVGVH